MSLLPQQILSQQIPFGSIKAPDGTTTPVLIEKDWWLLLYNLCQNTLGTATSSGAALPATALTEIAALDSDVADTDAVSLRALIANALILAQDHLLPDLIRPPVLVTGSYTPGAFLIPTGTFGLGVNRLQLLGVQRGQVMGTGRLSVRN